MNNIFQKNPKHVELPSAMNLPARCDLELARQLYNLDYETHPFVETWKPKVIGRGGEHIVYRSESEPDVVLKLNIDLIEKAILSPSDKTNQKILSYAEKVSQRIVPKQTVECIEIPVTEGMLHWQFRGNPPKDTPKVVLAAVAKQEFLPVLGGGELLTVVSGYSEKRSDDLTALKRMNQLLKCNLPAEEISTIFNSTQITPALRVLLDKALECMELKAALANFVLDTFKYVKETSEILDLAGGGNVILADLGKGWNCYLADALYPSRENMFARTKDAVARIISGNSLDKDESNILMNGLNFVRTINGLANALDVPNRLDVAPSIANIEEFDFVTPIRLTQLG
jgi:hypothetical protein